MRSRAIFLGCILLLSTTAKADQKVRYVFNEEYKQIVRQFHQPLNKFSFGLSDQQVADIKQLTNGNIDFGSTYYFDAPISDLKRFDKAEVLHPNVPPPFTFKSVHHAGDPSLMNQWWIHALKVPGAWRYATGAGVIIADCDAGFYHNEPELFANMLLHDRYDLSNYRNPYTVDDGSNTSHGTAVAAIMVGVLNGSGTSGIAYNAKLVPLQNFNYDNTDALDKEEATARCVMRAISTPGVQIIVLENQMETSSSEGFSGTRNAVRLAIQSGIIVVGAGGNSGYPLTAEQRDDTGSIIVGALDRYGNRASYSNYGSRVTVSAFGEDLYTLYGQGGYFGMFGGTSGATPQVAATVALMKEVNPYLTPAQARQILRSTMTVTSNNGYVGGQLNTESAVLGARAVRFQITDFKKQQKFRMQLTNILNSKI